MGGAVGGDSSDVTFKQREELKKRLVSRKNDNTPQTSAVYACVTAVATDTSGTTSKLLDNILELQLLLGETN
ncbi:hypothetical protein E2C01_034989 [Portunus trituberculatus]|uniref:Uncharacterized protein n=1 Tax=Portunus trituberculatus TaxID=210409 RepID=A0A5B7F843_PORTR|nr:hypothetical protein [Portunus trituberculatus]